MNVFDSLYALGRYSEALEFLDNVKPEFELLPKDVYVSGYYARRGLISYALGDPESGAAFVDQAIDLVHSHFDSFEFHPLLEKITRYQIALGDLDRVRQIYGILSSYAEESGFTLDIILAKRVQAHLCYAAGEEDLALTLYKELNGLYEQRVREQKAIQYESQKSVEDANREIVKLMNQVYQSREKADRDPLTGLMNRSALVRVTTDFIWEAKARGKCLGGIFFDIDFFKEYNDTYGHAAGDEAIKFIARVALENETNSVRFFRYGGDEYFGIVLGLDDADFERIALGIFQKVRSSGFPHAKNPNGQRLTVSMGLVNLNMKDSDCTILDIIKYADAALYHAKDRGRDDIFKYCVLPDSEHQFRRISAESDE